MSTIEFALVRFGAITAAEKAFADARDRSAPDAPWIHQIGLVEHHHRSRSRADPGRGIVTATPFDSDHAFRRLSAELIPFLDGRGSRRPLYEDETADRSLRAVPRIPRDHRRIHRDGRWHRHTPVRSCWVCRARNAPQREAQLASGEPAYRARRFTQMQQRESSTPPIQSDRHRSLRRAIVDENWCDADQPIS
jgi:hypothetical protein